MAGVNSMLHHLGFSHTRPTYTLAKEDEQKQQALAQEIEMIKKLITDDMLPLSAESIFVPIKHCEPHGQK
ncbi:winged helix-turn-helix domain-containing protein [Thermaerobacillus caldiproteolyticus]|uniref:Winged helix-turn helix domain-containing protein n=2 Tax=Thermaerobacillus caldiproteolyticus TaxID=247480 RepID=A0A7V9Z8P5_9BACL|nr:winged helix-turn-helix domain-containing protein [Anoxybacillus caldiproteolyticus]MBA2876016.1 hypothetical protein [Anoxybacillus caldiproteolyticus]